MDEQLHIRLSTTPHFMGFALHLFQKRPDGYNIAKPIIWEKIKEGTEVCPCITVHRKELLQELMDDMWLIGLRPSFKADEYKAQLETMKYHLEDMRTLVFKRKR